MEKSNKILWNAYIILIVFCVIGGIADVISDFPHQTIAPSLNYYLDIYGCFLGIILVLALTQYRFNFPNFHYHLWRFLSIFFILYIILFALRAGLWEGVTRIGKSLSLMDVIVTFFGILFFIFLMLCTAVFFIPFMIAYANIGQFKKIRNTIDPDKDLTQNDITPREARLKEEVTSIKTWILVIAIALVLIILGLMMFLFSKDQRELEDNEQKIERFLIAGEPNEALTLAYRNLALIKGPLKIHQSHNNPDYPKVEKELANVYVQLGKLNLAEQHMKLALDDIDPGNFSDPSGYKAEYAFGYALILVENKKYKEALPYFEYNRKCAKFYKWGDLSAFYIPYLIAQFKVNPAYDPTDILNEIKDIIAHPNDRPYKVPLAEIGNLRRILNNMDKIKEQAGKL